MPGTAPSLAETPFVAGQPETLVRILLHGMSGPVTVDGVDFDADMPPSVATSDDQIAALGTFVRRSFGNQASPIAPEQVSAVRLQTSGRSVPWTVSELGLEPEK